MDLTPAELRHSIRGAFNALKLCVSAFEMPLETSEKLEFLSDIESSAHRIGALLQDFADASPPEQSDEVGGDVPASSAAAALGEAAGAGAGSHVR